MSRIRVPTRVLGSLFGLVLSCLLLAPTIAYGQSGPVSAQVDATVPGEVIVKLAAGASLADVASAYALDPQPIEQLTAHRLYRLRITDGADAATKAAAVDSDARVEFAEPNKVGAAPEKSGDSSWSSGDSSWS